MKDIKWLEEHEKVTTEDVFEALQGDVRGRFRLSMWSAIPETLGAFQQIVDLVSYHHSEITKPEYVDGVFVSTLNSKTMNYVSACELLRRDTIRDALVRMIETPTIWTNRGDFFQQEAVYHHCQSTVSFRFSVCLYK